MFEISLPGLSGCFIELLVSNIHTCYKQYLELGVQSDISLRGRATLLIWGIKIHISSIRIRIWTICSWHWNPSSAQFTFLVMASKQASGNMVELSTFLTRGKKEVIRHKTLSLSNGKIMVNHIWFKACAAHKNYVVNQLKGNAKQSAQAFIQGTNVVTKHQVWTSFCFFSCKIMKSQNCFISVWNGSSQLKLFYNVLCYIIRYSLTLISPKIIRHLGSQAHNIAAELEKAKPNNEKAVSTKAQPSTIKIWRKDCVYTRNRTNTEGLCIHSQ